MIMNLHTLSNESVHQNQTYYILYFLYYILMSGRIRQGWPVVPAGTRSLLLFSCTEHLVTPVVVQFVFEVID